MCQLGQAELNFPEFPFLSVPIRGGLQRDDRFSFGGWKLFCNSVCCLSSCSCWHGAAAKSAMAYLPLIPLNFYFLANFYFSESCIQLHDEGMASPAGHQHQRINTCVSSFSWVLAHTCGFLLVFAFPTLHPSSCRLQALTTDVKTIVLQRLHNQLLQLHITNSLLCVCLSVYFPMVLLF